MLIDRSHRVWALFSLISLTAATIGWTVSLKYSPAGASGGSFSGLLFGILGTAMMLFAGLLAGRRPLRHLPLGSARFWMKGHLWLGTLCIPFILFHSGFAWGGVLEQLLWYCLAFVALSGFFGLAVQQFLPGLLWKSVPLETFEPQAPWLCDRLTLVNDTKLSAVCERQLDAPAPHLQEPARRTVAAFQKLMDGPGARNEKNARKLLLLQEVSPPAVRDFFWAMAKYSRTELKAIGFDGDFPELLGRLYSDLRPPTVPSPAETPTPGPAGQPATTESAAPAHTAAPATTKLSPLDAMRQKAAQKAATASADAGGPAASEPPAAASSDTVPSVPSVPSAASGAPAVKLSPLEQMRQKAAQKAAAASADAGGPAASEPPAAASSDAVPSVPSAASGAPAVKLSPLEQMRQKAAQKAAAASADAGVPAASEPPAAASSDTVPSVPSAASGAPAVKLSPLEQMRQKAAQKAAAASADAGVPAASEPPAAASPDAVPSASSAASAASGAPAVKLSPLEQMRQKAAQKAAAASADAGVPAASEPPAVASPAPLTAAVPAASAAPASTPLAGAVKPPVVGKPAAGKPPIPPVRSPGDGSAGARQPPPESAPPIGLSPDEKGVLWDFYVNQVRPYLMEHGSGGVVRRSRLATETGAQLVFREQRALLPKSLYGVLDELSAAVEVRRQLEQQRRLLRWMHWWLMLHVPVSILLLVFLAAHVLMALRVVPLQF